MTGTVPIVTQSRFLLEVGDPQQRLTAARGRSAQLFYVGRHRRFNTIPPLGNPLGQGSLTDRLISRSVEVRENTRVLCLQCNVDALFLLMEERQRHCSQVFHVLLATRRAGGSPLTLNEILPLWLAAREVLCCFCADGISPGRLFWFWLSFP